MRAAVASSPGTWSVEEVPDPTPGPMEVVVEVDRCGVCGTDLQRGDGEVHEAGRSRNGETGCGGLVGSDPRLDP
ncbi:MAG: hypothetical protein ACYCTE_04945 [Acidimicrobiales bacterium]